MLLLLKRTKESLYAAVEMAVAGKRVGDIRLAVQEYVESFGYSVVRELVGHGIGRNCTKNLKFRITEERDPGMKLQEGLTICIEPMINLGTKNVMQANDGWTIRTADKMPSAHFELTVAVMKGQADMLSTFRYIEEDTGPNKI